MAEKRKKRSKLKQLTQRQKDTLKKHSKRHTAKRDRNGKSDEAGKTFKP